MPFIGGDRGCINDTASFLNEEEQPLLNKTWQKYSFETSEEADAR